MAQQNWWEAAPVVDAPPAPVAAPGSTGGLSGYIPGAPKPDKPAEPKTSYRTLSPAEIAQRGLPPGVYQESSEGKVDKIGDAPKDAAGDGQTAAAKLRNVIDKIDTVAIDSADNNGWFETGFTGRVGRMVEGTAAYDLAANVKTIDANSAFEALAEMRRNSPTGGALGAIAVPELELLKSSVANLDTGQSQSSFFGNLAQTKKVYLDMLRRIDPVAADEYAKRKGIKFGKDGSPYLSPVDGEDEQLPRGDPLGINGGDIPPGGPPPPAGAQRNVDAVGAALYGAADTLTAGFSDEIAAGLGAAFGTGSGSFGDRYERSLAEERRARDQIRGEYGAAYTTGQVGGALLPFGLGAKAVGTIRGAAGAGALQGGAYGIGSTDGGIANRALGGVVGAGIGAAGGAAAGYAVPKVAGALSGFVNSPARVAARKAELDLRANAQPVIQAAEAEGVRISRPLVDPTTRNAVTALETTQTGGPIIQQGLRETAEDLAAGVQRLGAGGTAGDEAIMGEAIQGAGTRFIDRTRTIDGRLYARAERLTGNATADPSRAIQALDNNIAELRASGESANKPQIDYLEGLKSDLSRGPMTIQALRGLRSQMRGQINSRNLTATDSERRVGQVLSEASKDIEAALANNPAALRAYQKADGFYRQRQTYIQDVLQKFMGRRDQPISSEQAFSKLQSMATPKGDSRRLAELMRTLDPQEATDVAATFAEGLGRDVAGNFSPTLLASQASKLSARARETIFGPEGAKSLENLRIIANEARRFERSLNNSRTGVATNYRSWLGRVMGLAGAGAGFASSGGVSAIVGGVAARGAGNALEGLSDAKAARLLMNHDITKWLNSAPSTTNAGAINRHAARLDRIASRTPYLVADIQTLQSRLIEAARMSGPAAADEEENPAVRGEK